MEKLQPLGIAIGNVKGAFIYTVVPQKIKNRIARWWCGLFRSGGLGDLLLGSLYVQIKVCLTVYLFIFQIFVKCFLEAFVR